MDVTRYTVGGSRCTSKVRELYTDPTFLNTVSRILWPKNYGIIFSITSYKLIIKNIKIPNSTITEPI